MLWRKERQFYKKDKIEQVKEILTKDRQTW